jgi:hypothetical protein
MPGLPGKFVRAQSGVAAIEFALLMPLLLVMLLGSFELQRYLRIERQLSLTANNMAALYAQRQEGNTDILNVEINVGLLLFQASASEPGRNFWDVLVSQVSSIAFAPSVAGCTQDCTYVANLAWRAPANQGSVMGHMHRGCGRLTPAPDGAEPTGATLPAAIFGPGSLVVVDYKYEFKPLFGSSFVPSIVLFRQGYASPRYMSPFLKLPRGHNAVYCPGY